MEKKIGSVRLRELEEAERKLRALEAGGVDNWDGYDSAMEDVREETERDAKMEDCLVEIETLLLSHMYEPSERGAGYAATDEDHEQAFEILKNFVRTLQAKRPL